MKRTKLIFFIFLMLISVAFSQNDIENFLIQITEKEEQIKEIDSKIENLNQEAKLISEKISSIELKKKPDLKKVKNKKNKATIELNIQNLSKQKKNIQIEILKIKETIFINEESGPVWADGFGELIQDKNQSAEECKRLVLMYARRDAMEKGGKIIIQSFTTIKRVEVIVKDEKGTQSDYYEKYLNIIKSKSIVEVIDQDLSEDYGQVKRIKEDDIVKYTVKVRLKVRSIGDFNPYTQELREFSN